MGEIILVRHGQANSHATNEAEYDRLSDRGHRQAELLGAWFRDHGYAFDHVWSGTLRRHRETASAIAEGLNLPQTSILPGLDEMDFDMLLEDAAAAGLVDLTEVKESAIFAAQQHLTPLLCVLAGAVNHITHSHHNNHQLQLLHQHDVNHFHPEPSLTLKPPPAPPLHSFLNYTPSPAEAQWFTEQLNNFTPPPPPDLATNQEV